MSKARRITHPVGRDHGNHGNQPNDVALIQEMLNNALDREPMWGDLGLAKLEVNGKGDNALDERIKIFQQAVMHLSRHDLNGTIRPNDKTWKALNGNVSSMAKIKSQPTGGWVAGYNIFRQGHYKDQLGTYAVKKISVTAKQGFVLETESGSISSYGCLLCTLTMAATHIGTPTEYWRPKDLKPEDLTPVKANEILRSASAFSGFILPPKRAAEVLGMKCEDSGRGKNLSPDDLQKIDAHLSRGNPVAANVDYKGSPAEDHWILIISRGSDGTYRAIDPAFGETILLTSEKEKHQRMISPRYGEIREERDEQRRRAMEFVGPEHFGLLSFKEDMRTGVLFGWIGSGSRQPKQYEQYIVIRYALLSPL